MTVSAPFIVFQTCKHTRRWLPNNHIQDMVSTNKIENIIFIFIYCIPKQMKIASLQKPECSRTLIFLNIYYRYIYKVDFIYIDSIWTHPLIDSSWHSPFPGTLHITSGTMFIKNSVWLLIKDELTSAAYSLSASLSSALLDLVHPCKRVWYHNHRPECVLNCKTTLNMSVMCEVLVTHQHSFCSVSPLKPTTQQLQLEMLERRHTLE